MISSSKLKHPPTGEDSTNSPLTAFLGKMKFKKNCLDYEWSYWPEQLKITQNFPHSLKVFNSVAAKVSWDLIFKMSTNLVFLIMIFILTNT